MLSKLNYLNSLKPNLNSIKKFKFYNLWERNWKGDASPASIKFNKPILQNIAIDFSDFAMIEAMSIMNIFGKYILGKSAEDLLLLYTNKGSNDVFYYFTHYATDTYKELSLK